MIINTIILPIVGAVQLIVPSTELSHRGKSMRYIQFGNFVSRKGINFLVVHLYKGCTTLDISVGGSVTSHISSHTAKVHHASVNTIC